MANTIVAVEVDVHDGTAIRTLRYFSGRDPLSAIVAGARLQYLPGLTVPLTFGATISAEQYGDAVRGAPNGGDIVLDIGSRDYASLAVGMHFTGQKVRVYSG